MNLHILSQSPSKSSAMQDMLTALSAGDAIILIEDGVIAALHSALSKSSLTETPIYILEADLMARGLRERVKNDITVVTDSEFVKLCCQYSKTVSWF